MIHTIIHVHRCMYMNTITIIHTRSGKNIGNQLIIPSEYVVGSIPERESKRDIEITLYKHG